MAIIVSCVAAVLVIIGLVWFNIRHATAEKEEIKEELSAPPDAPHTAPDILAGRVEHDEAEKKSQSDEPIDHTPDDQFYRQTLQKYQQREPLFSQDEPEQKMNDDMYRSVLQKLNKKENT
ncbi:hypothetical protein [Bacillus sp. 179-C3.3 HS]|uniref:hypothetical protein n=1 Tax=Bacillus sp. 179-C3.3 HS TaxID=3232162 RepID=UPI0039A24B9E